MFSGWTRLGTSNETLKGRLTFSLTGDGDTSEKQQNAGYSLYGSYEKFCQRLPTTLWPSLTQLHKLHNNYHFIVNCSTANWKSSPYTSISMVGPYGQAHIKCTITVYKKNKTV